MRRKGGDKNNGHSHRGHSHHDTALSHMRDENVRPHPQSKEASNDSLS